MSMIRSAVSDEFISTSLDVPRCFLLQVPQLRGDLIDWLTPLGSKAVGRHPSACSVQASKCRPPCVLRAERSSKRFRK